MKFWHWLNDESSAPAAPGRWIPLRVVARAMCCAVGHSAPAASAAINARMNHFRETEFVDEEGAAIMGAALYEVPSWGAERLGLMLRTVLAEVLAPLAATKPEQVAVLLLTAEPGRPGMPHDALANDLQQLLAGAAGLGPFHAASGMYAYGKGGIARLMQVAAGLLDGSEAPEYVLLAAADSLLDAGAIEHFLELERIATPGNADGFIPGEGAAALVLGSRAAGHPALWIEAAASAQEEWTIGGERPLRAVGLAAALREATRSASAGIADLDFHASGMTGEGWYAKEVSLACRACWRGANRTSRTIWSPADLARPVRRRRY